MGEITFAQVGEFIKSFGLPFTMLALILFGGAKKVWVWGYQLEEARQHVEEERERNQIQLEEAKEECEEWKRIALRSLGHSEQAAAIVQQTVNK